jgi:hypothetical protein
VDAHQHRRRSWPQRRSAKPGRCSASSTGQIVELIAGLGHSVEHAAALVLGKPKLSDRDHEHVGRRLREALSALARRWHPISTGSRIRSTTADGARPVAGAEGPRSVEGRVAHAAGHGVRYSERTDGEAPAA